VIAVGAVGDDALPAPYSEACSALFVVAPSSGGRRSITTTDLVGDPGYDPASGSFTDRFGGTAAAAPVVSGVVALMLATNPSLTVRDVQHVLVRSSVQLEPADPGWSTGPFPHHELFGFGLVDAAAAVATARSWANVEPGSYFLSAVVDVAGAVAEGLESNNGTTAAGQIVVTSSATAAAMH